MDEERQYGEIPNPNPRNRIERIDASFNRNKTMNIVVDKINEIVDYINGL